MSSSYTPVGQERREMDFSYLDDEQGYGLVTFAGVMIALVAVLNVLYGIAAIDKATFFAHDAKYVIGNLATWGWFLVALGILQGFAAFGIWRGASWARWFGVACAVVNSVLQTLFIPAAPVLAMTILALDITVIYALLVYGGRRAHARKMREMGQA
jgi:uncharacterized membrane protein (DUF2068 family)